MIFCHHTLATALEAQADAILEAAETGKMNMPSGEYLRMANEAKALWDQAQDLKGTKDFSHSNFCLTENHI